MEVEHMIFFKANLTAEVFANNALPSRMEVIIKQFL
jgi:hypothetical protein